MATGTVKWSMLRKHTNFGLVTRFGLSPRTGRRHPLVGLLQIDVETCKPMSRSSIARSNLRAVVIIIVLAFHSVLPYPASLPAAAYPFDRAPYQWLAFPIVDNERWFGFDLFCAWQYLGLMTLRLFLSGLFVSSSLARKGSWNFLSEVRNIMECVKSIMRPPVGCQAWELDDAEKAEKLIRNLAS